MNEQDDLRLNPESDPEADLPLDPDPPRDGEADARPLWPWFAGLIIVAAVVAGVVYLRRPTPPAPVPTPAPAPVATQASQAPAGSSGLAEPMPPLGPAVEPVDVPALDASDAVVRTFLHTLSARPELAAWLATDGLVRNLAACIDNVADGKSPAPLLKPLAPRTPFTAAGDSARPITASASFTRYNGLAATMGALDMQAVARAYSTLKPRLDEAYQDLGHKPGEVDLGVARALAHLLETPTIRGDAALTRVVLSFRYVDDDVEALSGAQKQVLRMGPRNAQIVLAKLRELAAALGVPAERLPPAR